LSSAHLLEDRVLQNKLVKFAMHAGEAPPTKRACNVGVSWAAESGQSPHLTVRHDARGRRSKWGLSSASWSAVRLHFISLYKKPFAAGVAFLGVAETIVGARLLYCGRDC